MARSRNIKPGFFTNDVLGELPPLARLLFAGLWTICDRDGRCEDRPKKIRAEVLPYDDCDADSLLDQLASAGFIDRYEAAGRRVIHVVNWDKHQNPHVKEAASTLPARCESGAGPVQAPDKEQPKPEQAGLIPSSLIPSSLIPDSLEPEVGAEAAGSKAAPKRVPFNAEAIDLPDWLSPETWGLWVRHRIAKRKPMTEDAAKLSIKALSDMRDQGIDPRAAIEHGVASGNQGLFPPPGARRLLPTTPRLDTAARNAETAAILDFDTLETINATH